MDKRAPVEPTSDHTAEIGSTDLAGRILAHLDGAYNLARWLVHDEHDAQDIVQEAALRALRSIASYRGGDPRAWLFTIVRNACFDRLRRDQASPIEPMSDQIPTQSTPHQADPARILQTAEDIQRVRHSIAQLPPPIREVLVLREMQGLSYKEVASIAGVPIGTVMSRLARGRRQLAQVLSEEPQ